MASKLVLPQLALARRQMASVAAKRADAGRCPQAETSLLPSGLKVASLDNDATALATVSVLVKAGSSFESYDSQGASHALRTAVGLSSKHYTSFAMTRSIQQLGGHINVIGSREYLMYTLIAAKPDIREVFDFFNDMITNPAFKSWELKDNLAERMILDVAEMSPGQKALELLHKAAYRQGLGNSLYSPEYMIGKHKSDALASFHAKTHTVTRSVFAAHGLDHGTASRLGQSLHLEKGHGPSNASKYYGGEAREDNTNKLAVIAIAGETCPADNVKQSLAFMLLKNVLGNGSAVKRGGFSGKLGKAVAKIEGQKAVAGINFTYENTGLCGAMVTCEPAIAGNVVAEVVGALKNVSVSDEELNAAKKTFLVDTSEAMLNPESVTETLASHTLFGVDSDASSLGSMINSITTADLNAAAKKLASGKLSMSAVGNLKTLPYLDSM